MLIPSLAFLTQNHHIQQQVDDRLQQLASLTDNNQVIISHNGVAVKWSWSKIKSLGPKTKFWLGQTKVECHMIAYQFTSGCLALVRLLKKNQMLKQKTTCLSIAVELWMMPRILAEQQPKGPMKSCCVEWKNIKSHGIKREKSTG